MTEEEKNPNNNEVAEVELEQIGDIEACKQALAEERGKAEKYLASWQRVQADFINYKKHVEQEKEEMAELTNSTLILNMLPIMDDLERAFVSLPARLSNSNWIEGIELIYNKFKTVLESQGLTEIKAKGEPFDPYLHEAVMRQEGEEGIVLDEIQKGYKLKDRVIRPSRVIVGEGKNENK